VNDFILTGFESFGRQGMAAHSINTGRIVWRAFHQGAANEMLNDVTTRILGQRPATNLSLDDNKQTLPGQVAWDAQSNTVFYVSTAQTGTDPVNQSPLFSTTIHARDTETGISRWQYQIAPQAGLAVSTTGEIILLNMEDETGLLPVLVYFANNGFVYTLERASGQFIKAEQFAEASNWAELINPETGMPVLIEDEDEGIGKTICPSSLGARSHQPSAYNPRTNLFYIQPHQTCMQFTEVEMEIDSENAMTLNSLEIIQLPLPQQTQIEMSLVPAQGVSNTGTANLGSVAAWDMNNNSQRWTIDEAWPVMSGLLTTAGDVVYYGTLDGYIKAVDAKTGAYLWHFRAPSGITGNFVTWEYKSKQYLAVVSGSADSASLLAGDETKEIPIQGGGSLLVFSLP
jgi:glucose dehydrogenase